MLQRHLPHKKAKGFASHYRLVNSYHAPLTVSPVSKRTSWKYYKDMTLASQVANSLWLRSRFEQKRKIKRMPFNLFQCFHLRLHFTAKARSALETSTQRASKVSFIWQRIVQKRNCYSTKWLSNTELFEKHSSCSCPSLVCSWVSTSEKHLEAVLL